jgi:hypothetical protein
MIPRCRLRSHTRQEYHRSNEERTNEKCLSAIQTLTSLSRVRGMYLHELLSQ